MDVRRAWCLRPICAPALGLLLGSVWGCESEAEPCSCALADASSDVAEASDDGVLTDAHEEQVTAFCAGTWGFQAGTGPQCCTQADQATSFYKYLQDAAQAFWHECQERLSYSASRGRIEFDAAASAGCVQAFQDTFAARGCEMLWTGMDWEASSCRGAIVGLQPEGAPCAYRYECLEGLTCLGNGLGLEGTCGQPQAGGACREQEYTFAIDHVLDSMLGRHPACAAGWSCLHTIGANGVCIASTGQGGSCSWDAECEPGLRCHLATCGTQGPATQGAACSTVLDCTQRLLCEAADAGDQGTCVPRKAAGEPCSTAVDACRGLCVSADGGDDGVCVDFCGSG